MLAAGSSRRFGADKRMARLPDGTSLLQAALRPLRASADHVLVVLRPEDAVLAAQCAAEGIVTLACPDAAQGMGHSLAAAARALQDPVWRLTRLPGCAGVPAALVALADMPAIRPATVAALVAALRAGSRLVRPRWQGQAGHPVGFGAAWLPALALLQGDTGARDLLREGAGACEWIVVEDPGIVRDIDTPAALAAWCANRPA